MLGDPLSKCCDPIWDGSDLAAVLKVLLVWQASLSSAVFLGWTVCLLARSWLLCSCYYTAGGV
jgi:hypothetical protein